MGSWVKEAFSKAIVKALTTGIIALAVFLWLVASQHFSLVVRWTIAFLNTDVPLWQVSGALLLVGILAIWLLRRASRAPVTSPAYAPIYSSRSAPLSEDATIILKTAATVLNVDDDCQYNWLRDSTGLSKIRFDEAFSSLEDGEYIHRTRSTLTGTWRVTLEARGRQWAIAHTSA